MEKRDARLTQQAVRLCFGAFICLCNFYFVTVENVRIFVCWNRKMAEEAAAAAALEDDDEEEDDVEEEEEEEEEEVSGGNVRQFQDGQHRTLP